MRNVRVYKMKVISAFACLFLLANSAQSQMEDRNWCFGYRGGINFNDPNGPQIFESKTSNYEISASISDSIGNLLLYLGRNAITGNIINDIMDGNHEIVQNGEDIETSGSSARGAIIIPNYDRTKYFVFHTSFPSCSPGWCGSLQYTLIDMEQNGGQGSAVERNVLLLDDSVEEGLSATKHANGKDWWLLVHKHRRNGEPDCTDRFFKFLIQDTTILGPYIQDIGSNHCNLSYPGGEPRFSPQGNYLSFVSFMQNVLDVYCFNRFTGELTSLVNISGLDGPYSSEFSPNERFLYVVSGFSGGNNQSTLDQYDLASSDIPNSKITIWQENDQPRSLGQLQIAPDKKIYVAIGFPNGGTGAPGFQDTSLSYISRINSPDSLGLLCDLSLYDFYLGDSSLCYINLPNIPNYNLAPLSFHESDTAENKVICLGDTSINGVVIGSPSVPGVMYSWSPPVGLNNSSIAQPFVSISSTQIQTRTYVLTMTDSTISSLCQRRIDTVLVEVKDCSVGVNEMSDIGIAIYPNPTRGFITIEAVIPLSRVWLTDLSGRKLQTLDQSGNLWKADLRTYSAGIYLIEAITKDGGHKIDKVIKSE